MASTAASVSRSAADAEGEVSLVRLYVLRATYLLLVVGLGAMIVPVLFSHEAMARGVIPSLLGAVWLLAFVGLRYPLQMLPLLMFEFGWKTIWLIAFGLPQWSSGKTPADLRRRLQKYRLRRDADADRHPVGLRLSPLRQTAGEPLAVKGQALLAPAVERFQRRQVQRRCAASWRCWSLTRTATPRLASLGSRGHFVVVFQW
jgi:hypothetical protein